MLPELGSFTDTNSPHHLATVTQQANIAERGLDAVVFAEMK